MHSPTFVAAMKQRLEDEQARLEVDLREIATEDPQHPGHYIAKHEETEDDSEEDTADTITTFTDGLTLVEQLEAELRDVKHSLESIANKAYGICKYCKEPIDPKRLEARPTSSACISCKKTLTQEL